MSSNRPVIRLRFVDDVDQTAIGLRLGPATGKIRCTGELPSSDWEKPKRTDRLKRCIYVHRSIMDRFALQAPIAVTTFEWMPL